MTIVHETIPEGLRSDVDATLAWWNGREEVAFEVTGILDPETALEASGTRELRLILCGGDRCEQRSFRVAANGDDYEIALLDDDRPAAAGGQLQAELDPPPGALRGWLGRSLSQHSLVVLVFYRGYW
jgi:hypothetical protein